MNNFLLHFWREYHRNVLANGAVGIGSTWLAAASIPQESLAWWVQVLQIAASLTGILVGLVSAANMAFAFYHKLKNKGK